VGGKGKKAKMCKERKLRMEKGDKNKGFEEGENGVEEKRRRWRKGRKKKKGRGKRWRKGRDKKRRIERQGRKRSKKGSETSGGKGHICGKIRKNCTKCEEMRPKKWKKKIKSMREGRSPDRCRFSKSKKYEKAKIMRNLRTERGYFRLEFRLARPYILPIFFILETLPLYTMLLIGLLGSDEELYQEWKFVFCNSTPGISSIHAIYTSRHYSSLKTGLKTLRRSTPSRHQSPPSGT
jgi:hypothetical protein